MVCFWNKTNNDLVFVPDENEAGFERECWQEELEKIEKNPNDFHEIRKLHSSESFRFMEEFTKNLPDNTMLKVRLMKALVKKKAIC